MGPRSRDLLAALTDADLSTTPSRSAPAARSTLGYATVRATRITYVGELGWELYVPTEFAVGVYEDLMAAGADLGVRRGGYYAIESLRLEKGYRAFGRELTPDVQTRSRPGCCSPASSRPTSTSSAAPRSRRPGPTARAAGVVVLGRRPGRDAVGWRADAARRRPPGQVTSAAWGETVGAASASRTLWDPAGDPIDPAWVRAASYQVDVGADVLPISVSLRPLVDPDGLRTKASDDGSDLAEDALPLLGVLLDGEQVVLAQGLELGEPCLGRRRRLPGLTAELGERGQRRLGLCRAGGEDLGLSAR